MGKRMELAQAAQTGTGFNERLATLRMAAGFTQVELAGELGISQRMMRTTRARTPRRRRIYCRPSPRPLA